MELLYGPPRDDDGNESDDREEEEEAKGDHSVKNGEGDGGKGVNGSG